MIDTHCHLLPGLDDGPSSMTAAILLAAKISDAGVTTVLCTTHHSSRFPTQWSDVLSTAVELRRALAARGVPLELIPTAEVGAGYAVRLSTAALIERSIQGLYVVVEVDANSTDLFFETVASRLREVALVPIFAHPERARSVQRSRKALEGARREGALVQVVAPSLLGRWGSEVAVTAWRLVEQGTADLLGSDVHGLTRRRFYLPRAARLVEDRLDAARAEELTFVRPREVLGLAGSF